MNIGSNKMPKGYWIGHITVRDAEAYKEYIERDTPILQALGGNFLVRGGSSEVPEGEAFERHIVIEFPSYQAALAAYHDPDYQVVADIRRRSADSTIIVVEGVA
jgi:uncharacterized protein (DUF1330 family)